MLDSHQSAEDVLLPQREYDATRREIEGFGKTIVSDMAYWVERRKDRVKGAKAPWACMQEMKLLDLSATPLLFRS